jgi:adenylate cyclase
MWILTIRSALDEPYEHILKPGRSAIGRQANSDVTIPEESASRQHAELSLSPDGNVLTLRDLGSTNGTFVNRERVNQPRRLVSGDEIRIGQHVVSVDQRDTRPKPGGPGALPGTNPLTRDFLLESLDRHAVLLSEVAERLATVLDLDTALREVSLLMRRSMGADKCHVILADRFARLSELGFPTSIAQMAIEQRSAVILPNVDAQGDTTLAQSAMLLRIRSALCVPVLSGEEVMALIYVYKTGPLARPFDRRDLQLAVAISHQAALTIQRARLLRRIRKEQRIRELLLRFLAPAQADRLMADYLKSGRLPEVSEQTLTALFVDIRDSTGLAERLGAGSFSQLLGQYYQDMTQIVFDHGGLMHQYMGDGLMAIFGMFDNEAHASRAVRAGLAMLTRQKAVNVGGEEVAIGVGVNTGPMMAGYLEIQGRIEFSVLGDTINVCQRLESLARPNRLFVGPATYEAIIGQFNVQSVGSTELKGRTHPVDTYEVLPEPAALAE